MLVFYRHSHAATITSIANGAWSNTGIWNSGTVPGSGDDVIINSNIDLDINVTVNSITINAGKVLQDNGSSRTLVVNGTILNNGIIQRHPNLWYFSIYCKGNIVNNGTWKPFKTFFDGTTNQNLSGTGTFENPVYITDSIGSINLQSKIRFAGSSLEGSHAIVNTNGHSLYTLDQLLFDIRIVGNDTLNLHRTVIQNIVFEGQTKLAGMVYFKGTCESGGSLTILDTITSHYGSFDFYIHGHIINKGVIMRDPTSWYDEWFIEGNVENYGVWKPYRTYLTGTGNQTLKSGVSSRFENYFSIEDTLGDIVMNSAIRFEGSELQMHGARLHTNGYNLFTKNQWINAGSIVGNDTLELEQSVIENMLFNGHIRLRGNVFFKSGSESFGSLTILDTITSYYGSFSIHIHDKIINKGAILRDPNSWYNDWYIEGDIENYGIWSPFRTILSGTGDQTLLTGSTVFFGNLFLVSDTLGDIKLKSAVRFEGSELNLSGARLLTNGFSLITFAQFIRNGHILGDDTIHLNRSVIQDIVFTGNVKQKGFLSYRSGNSFIGTLTILDTLIDDNASYQLFVKGNIINKGALLRNNTQWYNQVHVTGNIENYGQWKPFQTFLSGVTDQQIKCGPGKAFENEISITDTLGIIILSGDVTVKSNVVNGNGALIKTNGKRFTAFDAEIIQVNFTGNDTLHLPYSRIEKCVMNGDFALSGKIYYKSNNVLQGTVTVLDTLTSHYASFQISVKGNIINRGYITRDENSWYNWVIVEGNIENYGKWNPFKTVLNGKTDQYLKSGPDVSFENWFFIDDTIGKIILNSHNRFHGNTLELNGSVLNANNFELRATSAEVINGTIESNDTLYFYNTVARNLKVKGNSTLTGKWYLAAGNEFHGNVTVLDTLMDNYASYVVHFYGNLYNYGVIKRAPSAWYFKLYCHGSVFTSHILDPFEIYLVDTYSRSFNGPGAPIVTCTVFIDDSIALKGNNILPTLAFTSNSKSWCRILPGASVVINNPNIGERLINYGMVTVTADLDTATAGTYNYYRASLRNKAHSSSTKIMVDHFGYQQHPTSDNAIRCWWRLRNIPQVFTDTLQWLQLRYTTDVLNGVPEDSLKVFHSSNAGISWNRLKSGIALDTVANTLSISNAPSAGHYLVTSNTAGSLSFTPQLTNAEPRFGGNTGNVTLYLFGAGFTNQCLVKLQKTGSSDIVADTMYITDITGESMLATFNLNGKATGLYNVIVEIPGKSTLALNGYFEIKKGERSMPWVMLTGRDRFLINRWQTFNLTYGNTANTDARGTMIMFTISDRPGLEVSFPDMVFVLPESIKAMGPDYTRIADSLPLYYVSDTFNGFEGKSIRIYPIYIPLIAAQSTESVRIRIKLTGSGDISMNTWLLDPWFENIDMTGKSSEPMPSEVRLCITAAAMKAFATGMIGMIPGADCYNLVDKIVDPIGMVTPESMQAGDQKVVGSGFWGLVSWASSITQCATSFMPGLGQAAKFGIAIGGFIFDGIDNRMTHEKCWAKFKAKSGNKHDSRGVSSFDPNEMVGPQGYGTEHYISKSGQKQYRIYFENKSTASAPALEVFIYDTLDKSKFDLGTFSFGHVTFGDTTVYVQEFAKAFSLLVDRYPAQHVIVQVNGHIDTSNGALFISFHSLDRISLELTEFDTLGFLPPNKVSPEGEGNIGFSVSLHPQVAHNDVVKNKATIVFDFNLPIVTNEYMNRIDLLPPVSTVLSLPVKAKDSVFTVSWSGSDQGAGIKSYTIMVSENDSAFTVWKSNISATSAVFNGRNFQKYAFYCLATDSIGLTEPIKLFADASIQIYDNTALSEYDAMQLQFVLYPNPVTHMAYLKTESIRNESVSLTITDLTGRTIRTQELQLPAGLHTEQIDFSAMCPGVYLLAFSNKSFTKVAKVLKE